MLKLGKYSFGTGDRFAHQGEAQLKASILAHDAGIELTHVWNKSNREHKIVKSEPPSVRSEADAAVKTLGWKGQYLVDADHINLTTLDGFVESSDFFTLDVADYIGMAVDPKEKSAYLEKYKKYIGALAIPGIEVPFTIDQNFLSTVADKFLFAAIEAGKIYRRIAKLKRHEDFVAEVSMDEVSEPQTPAELFFILGALADVGIPVQTIAPKFTGRFNKGVDYVGDVSQFAKEFEEDILVIRYAIAEFNLPSNLKLSVHSGSDKFSIYSSIKQLMKKYDAGVHVKTAGTTWLEELIGLAEAGGEGLELSKAIYVKALGRFDELTGPYATVIDIQIDKLPSVAEVNTWTGEKYANTLRHNQKHPDFNPHFRQLLHCGYKVAAEFDKRYYDALMKYKDVIARNVTENLFERHIKPIFI
ncbi:MAG: tagaturonate epimerase family protein [Cyclobacteriaceae bacterium]|nr:tagaturonate epimerase family protein [Cyclobacteriaceae bacterium]